MNANPRSTCPDCASSCWLRPDDSHQRRVNHAIRSRCCAKSLVSRSRATFQNPRIQSSATPYIQPARTTSDRERRRRTCQGCGRQFSIEALAETMQSPMPAANLCSTAIRLLVVPGHRCDTESMAGSVIVAARLSVVKRTTPDSSVKKLRCRSSNRLIGRAVNT